MRFDLVIGVGILLAVPFGMQTGAVGTTTAPAAAVPAGSTGAAVGGSPAEEAAGLGGVGTVSG